MTDLAKMLVVKLTPQELIKGTLISMTDLAKMFVVKLTLQESIRDTSISDVHHQVRINRGETMVEALHTIETMMWSTSETSAPTTESIASSRPRTRRR